MTTAAKRTWDPLTEFLDRVESGTGQGIWSLMHAPHVRVEDFIEDGTYVLRAEIPGIDPDRDVEVTLADGRLNIHGERREERKDRNRQEFQYGAFSRCVSMPQGLDPSHIHASYVDGVLEVRVPAATAGTAAPPVKIPVQRPDRR